MSRRLAVSAVLFFAALFATPASAQGGRLPFTEAENADGARFVWFIMGRAGFAYDYIPSDSFPTSGEFTRVDADSARGGDVVWWPHFVGVFTGPPENSVVLVGERQTVASITARRGKPRYYRKLVPASPAGR
jgi:hypothetical protein